MSAVGDRLGELIAAKFATRAAYSRACGIKPNVVGRYVNGKLVPSEKMCARLAAPLEIDPEELVALRREEFGDALRVQLRRSGDPTLPETICCLLDSVPGAVIKVLPNKKIGIAFEQTGAKSPLGEYLVKLARARRFYQNEGLDKAMYEDIARGLAERYEAAERDQAEAGAGRTKE